MCLDLSINCESQRNKLRASKKPLIVYKILDQRLFPTFRMFRWQLGENISSRESAELTGMESQTFEVHDGFHFFTSRSEACHYAQSYKHTIAPCYVHKCTVQPKDIVAKGHWGDYSGLVATKATLKKRIWFQWLRIT